MLHVVESRWICLALWVAKNWEHFLLSKHELMYFSLSSFRCITKSVMEGEARGDREGRERHLEPVQMGGTAE